jgi:radical SAM protein with 4Fe4S-binding SPASM domain
MSTTVSFRLDQPVPLPPDTQIWINHDASAREVLHPERGRKPSYLHIAGSCDGSSCDSCDCVATLPFAADATPALPRREPRRFLAISPQAATYIVLDASFLPAFMLLRDGHTPAQVGEWIADEVPEEQWKDFLKTLFKLIVLRNMRPEAELREDLPERPTLHLYVTNRCNLRCTHCYMSSGRPLPQGEMSTAERRRAIETFSGLGRKGKVSFSGGEALTSPDLFELIALARDNGHETELYTNGLLIRPSNVQRLVDSVDELQISLDGTNPETNDPIRGRGSFKRIVSAIHLVDKADRARNPDFFYRVGVTLTKSNCADVEQNILSFLSSLDLTNPHKIQIGVVANIGRAVDHPEVAAEVDQLPAIQSRVMGKFIEGGRIKWPNFSVNVLSKSCGIGMSVTVAADGNIYPCSVTEQPTLGNVRNADALAAMRSVSELTSRTGVDNVEGCRTCSLRYACRGMCRVGNLHRTGSMLQSSCRPAFKAARVESLIVGFDSYLMH